MPVRTHPGAPFADAPLGRKLILGLLILCLGAQLADRYPEVILPAAATARSDAPQATTQHLDNDAWHWFPTVASVPVTLTPGTARAPAPRRESLASAEADSSLYKRPPPIS